MTYYINIGTNLGDRQANIAAAVSALERLIGAKALCSDAVTSPPWGYQSNNEFLNIAVAIVCDIAPARMLALLKRIENNGDSRVKSSDIGSEAKEYLSFALEDDAIFKVKITVESDGMQRVCEAECYVKDNKVRYVKWVDDIPQVEE